MRASLTLGSRRAWKGVNLLQRDLEQPRGEKEIDWDIRWDWEVHGGNLHAAIQI